MARRKQQRRYSDEEQSTGAPRYGGRGRYDHYDDGGYDQYSGYDDEERGLVLQREQSLVNISSTVTDHGAPLLSYTRTMSRFYNNRRQRLSLFRHKCEVCGERIRFWAWQTPEGNVTHDGCYERLAWTWTNLYAHQQRLAAEGRLD
jgi:hypothetical protein